LTSNYLEGNEIEEGEEIRQEVKEIYVQVLSTKNRTSPAYRMDLIVESIYRGK